MHDPTATSWTLIGAAAKGDRDARDGFSRRYLPLVRAYLGARWAGTPLVAEIDDAVQEVFLDCFREGGVLERADPERGSGFRAFLHGVVTRAAQRIEVRRARELGRRQDLGFDPESIPGREPSLSRVFDREWAEAVMEEAAELQASQARARGPEALRRVELLHLRFHDGLPVRDIARLWGADPARVHHDYAQARKEFSEALREVVGRLERCSGERLEAECGRLIELLG
jgi:RNA polymerase sigma-70 factor (ECF subfamily)